MIMADVFKIVFLVLGTLLVLVAYWLAAAALFPSWVARTRELYEARPVKVTVTGLLSAIPLSVVGVVLLANGPNGAAKLLGALVLSIPILLALGGSAGFALRIGAGLALPIDEQAPWRRVLRGGAVLALCFLLPLVGWFLVFPWALVSGAGAALLAIRRRRRPVATVTELSR